MSIKIKANDRALIAGKTGSGKTYFAQAILSSVPRLIVIDSKGSLGEWGLKSPSALDWRKFEGGRDGRFRISPPVSDDLPGYFESLFARLYGIGDLTLYIDEAYAVVPSSARPGKWLTALYTRGRELGIGVWASTQRPAHIPLFLLSESDLLVSFKLLMKEDRERMAQMMGESVFDVIPDPHGFWIYDVTKDSPRYFPQVRTIVLSG